MDETDEQIEAEIETDAGDLETKLDDVSDESTEEVEADASAPETSDEGEEKVEA